MKKLIIYIVFLASFATIAQEKDTALPKGNNAFADKNYAQAEADYRISQSKFSKKATSSYNLGNAIYKQKQSAEAKYQFAKAINNAKTKPEKHKAFHNMGNCLMNEKNYSGAVDAYKNALRNNPNDEQTRYNYALAKKMHKENPEPPKENGGKDKDKQKPENQKDKNKDNQDQNEKDKQNKDNQGKDNQDKKNKGNDNQDNKNDNKDGDNPQKMPSGVNKQRIESLLEAMNNEEKKVQDKVKKQKVLTSPKKTDKDW